MSDDAPTPLWWAVSGTELLDALRRVSNGEDADLVYSEMYANATGHERVPCTACGGKRWVQTSDGPKTCSWCKPDADDLP